MNLWDLAGGEDYTEVRNEFYKEAQGCILVYDVTNRDSFESLPQWLEESQTYGAENMVSFLDLRSLHLHVLLQACMHAYCLHAAHGRIHAPMCAAKDA